jgi:putative two-component system response regulator
MRKKMKVLIVEDNEDSRNLLMKQLRAHGREVIAATNGIEAIEHALKHIPDIIVSDIMMPVMDGFQLCRQCKQNERLRRIPFVFYTATYLSSEDEKFALSLGIHAFIRKPTDTGDLVKILDDILEKSDSTNFHAPEIAPTDQALYLTEYNKILVAKLGQKVQELEQEITERKKAEDEIKEGAKKLITAMEAIIESISATVEVRDPYTAGHQRRVADLAFAIATELELPEATTRGLKLASMVHDIGKMYVPAEILSKPGKLNEIEYSMIQVHPQAGYDILKHIDFPWPIAHIVLQHHERQNGSGYPHGLSGEKIILEARILAVSDVVEAMSSHRPYRPSRGIDAALEEIAKNKGILFDNAVADACIRLFKEKDFKFE